MYVSTHNEGTFYIANGAGLLVSKDYGKTAEMVPNIKFCEAVGLGKAKNDGDVHIAAYKHAVAGAAEPVSVVVDLNPCPALILGHIETGLLGVHGRQDVCQKQPDISRL